ncbi:hypothetical protein BC941DRAFT_509415 [Chlamydoabsidia padenii]|nr:hypothetical protein BC941DRAFT_509415 [Chlamydoabsidia padenii]
MSQDNATTTKIVVDQGIVGPDTMEIGSEFISLACITVLAVALGAKTFNEKIKTLNYGRVLVIILYTLSWAFAASSIVVVSTNDNNIVSCTLGMMSCDFFYAGSKIAIYAWLIERVHLVTAVKTTRMKTCQYKFHICLLFPYVIIFILMLTFRNIYIEADGKCTIGLQYVASIPLLVYDFIFNCYLTWLFMSPLMSVGRNSRTDWKRSKLYRLARRTLVASVVCLTISFINVLLVVTSAGHQRGLICLTACTLDVTINVITVHWVTTNSGKSKNHGTTQKNMHTADHMTAEMTFDGADTHLEKTMKYDMPMVKPHKRMGDDDDSSIDVPMNGKGGVY